LPALRGLPTRTERASTLLRPARRGPAPRHWILDSDPLLAHSKRRRDQRAAVTDVMARASENARHSSRSLLATPARRSRRAWRSGRLGADARSRSAASLSLARFVTSAGHLR